MILIALGANLPFNSNTPEQTIRQAINVLDRLFNVSACSSLYRSEAWPNENDPEYINAVVSCSMSAHPKTVLKTLHSIEAGFGRQRTIVNAPRTLDLDLLAVDDLVITPSNKYDLALPHPRMANRDFVLLPLMDILPDWIHPETEQTIPEMLKALPKTKTRPLAT